MSLEGSSEKRTAAQQLVDGLLGLLGSGISVIIEGVSSPRATEAVQAIKDAVPADAIVSSTATPIEGKSNVLVILRSESPRRPQ